MLIPPPEAWPGFYIGGTEAERRRRENRGAEGGVGVREGLSPSPTD